MTIYAGWYSEDLQDRYGNGFSNAKVAVQTLEGEAIVLYADREKATYSPEAGLSSNEIKADAKGNLQLFADPGNYQILVTPLGGSTLSPYPVGVPRDPLEPQGILGLTSVKVDVVYAKEWGAIADNVQHPLSEFFDTLQDAQEVYPHATALTDLIDGVAIQAAIDAAELLVVSSSQVPIVAVGSGSYRINTPINWKRARLVGSGSNASTRVFWDGAEDEVVMTQATQASFNELSGINFRQGANQPLTWLDFIETVDVGCQLRDVHFSNSSGDAVVLSGGYINCHWQHLRWDGVGGYCIKVVAAASHNLSSFVLDSFTMDHQRASDPGTGFVLIDNSAGATQLGTFALKNARLEMNTAWTGHQAIVDLKTEKARFVGLEFENITYVDAAGMTSDVLVYHDSAATNLFPSLLLVNCRLSGLSAIVGGTLSANYPAVPMQANYGFLSVSQGGIDAIVSGVKLLTTSFGGETPLTLKRGAETQDRFQLGPRGELNWSSGSAATDLALSRSAASVLAMGTDDCFMTGKNVTGSRPSASAVGQGAQFFDTTLNKPIWSTGSVWVDATGATV